MIYFVGNEGLIKGEIQNTTIEHVYNYCKDKPLLGVDTETEGFFDFENKIVMLQIGDEKNQFVIDVRTTNIDILKPIFKSNTIKKLFWNAKFDYKFLKLHSIDTRNIIDCMLNEIVLTNGLNVSYSLETACLKYCSKQLDKSVRNQFVNLKGNPFTYKQITYGAEDVENLITIYNKQLIELKEKDSEVVSNLENRFVRTLSNIELNGFYLNADKWKELTRKNVNVLDTKKQTLNNYVFSNNHFKFISNQLDLFSTEQVCIINWDSPKQVIEYLDFLGVDTNVMNKRTNQISKSCEEKHLSKFKKKFDFIPLYLEYKQYAKSVSTYGFEFLSNINPITNRIHSDYWQIVSTGRMSSSNPNLQNIPNEVEYRSCFEGEGNNTLIVADYSQQEPRVLADLCQDENLVNLFLNGDGDTHTLVAEKMFSVIEGKPVKIDKKDPRRQIGKILNLKLNYGGSAYTVKDDLGVTAI
jgi:DNA polymerase-1